MVGSHRRPAFGHSVRRHQDRLTLYVYTQYSGAGPSLCLRDNPWGIPRARRAAAVREYALRTRSASVGLDGRRGLMWLSPLLAFLLLSDLQSGRTPVLFATILMRPTYSPWSASNVWKSESLGFLGPAIRRAV